jgi:hypothetical protein
MAVGADWVKAMQASARRWEGPNATCGHGGRAAVQSTLETLARRANLDSENERMRNPGEVSAITAGLATAELQSRRGD